MKLFRLTLSTRWGETFVTTLPARDLTEALSRVTLDPGWQLSGYSVLGVTA